MLPIFRGEEEILVVLGVSRPGVWPWRASGGRRHIAGCRAVGERAQFSRKSNGARGSCTSWRKQVPRERCHRNKDVQARRESVKVVGQLDSVWRGRLSVRCVRQQSVTARRIKEREIRGLGGLKVRDVIALIGRRLLQPDGMTSVATELIGAAVNSGCVSHRQPKYLTSAGTAVSSGSVRPASPTRVDLSGNSARKQIPFLAPMSYPVKPYLPANGRRCRSCPADDSVTMSRCRQEGHEGEFTTVNPGQLATSAVTRSMLTPRDPAARFPYPGCLTR